MTNPSLPVKARPILMSSPMVVASMTCRSCGKLSVPVPCCHCGANDWLKSQTRRIVKTDLRPQSTDTYMRGFPLDPQNVRMCGDYAKCDAPAGARSASYRARCPYGSAIQQDQLWVRETWAENDPPSGWMYRADDTTNFYASAGLVRWRPSIHMPRRASRITLEIESVRVERLQDIGEEDAKAEGVKPPGDWMDDDLRKKYDRIMRSEGGSHYQVGYKMLWESINGYGSWVSSPWVWAIGFRRVATSNSEP